MHMGVDNIRFGWDTEVNQLLIHNAPLTIAFKRVVYKYKPRLDISPNRTE